MTEPAGALGRRDFLQRAAVVGLAGAAAPAVLLERSGAPDLVLRGAVLADGTGAPLREADVAVTGGRVSAVGQVRDVGREELDLRGLVLAPGFIDIHSHADLNLLIEPRAESRIRQGVTLEVVGQDGSSILWGEAEARRTAERYRDAYGVEMDFRDLGGFLDHLDRHPVAVNVASMAGQGAIRGFVLGSQDRPATAGEVARMAALVREALSQGAVGLSSGLEYIPGSFASRDELVALASELRGTGYPYASHLRNEDDALLSAVEEALDVGRAAQVPVQVAHLKAQGRRTYWKAEVALAMIEAARADGVDVNFDRYPYVAYATGLSNLFPSWSRNGGMDAFFRRLGEPDAATRMETAAREKIALLGDWDAVQITSTGASTAWARGRRLGTLARERGVDPYALTLDLMRENRGSVGMIGFGMSEENTEAILAHPLGMVCSDGGAYAPYGPLGQGSPHPRGYGTFPRLLGLYVRERGVMKLETAVHKITGMPASKLRLADRGVVRVGAVGDLVAFDADTVADRATFESPHRYPGGIFHVVVNGGVTIRHGEHTGVLAGRSVRGVRYRG
ncbi:MAG TPA: D-aminoacylase [Longimicrobiales bacterium]|nr:D-aminoacylase [Longimicrobiales bacterium]